MSSIKKKFLSNNLEVVYGIALVLIIPLIIIINSVYTIKIYQETIDDSLNRNALQLGRTISSLIQDDLKDPALLQQKILNIAQKNSGLVAIDIYTQDKDSFQVIASLNPAIIGDSFNSYFLALAWQQPSDDGLARTTFTSSPTTINQTGNKIGEERFWIVAMPIQNEFGEKTALLAIKTSSEVIDSLANRTAKTSFTVIIITSLVLVLLLSVNTRLFQYSVLYKKTKKLDEMKNEFISMASHELRAPVTNINGFISMILEGSYGEINEEAKDRLKRVQHETKHLGILVEDLLNVNRIEQGKIEVNIEPIDIKPILKEVTENLKSRAQKKGLSLNYKSLEKESFVINADPKILRQILINLIDNAIKYTEKGNIDVMLEINNGKLNVKIKDTGIGMAPEQRERLFEKFYRVKSEKTKDIRGTGLGLWITKQLVELMRGHIFIDSMENVGTQVIIVFPLEKKVG